MKVIGITGGIGAGKSTVLHILEQEWNAFVLEADKVGHQVMEPGGCCYEAVVRLFGEQVIKNDKTIDRKKVSDVVFHVAEKRDALNQVIHPAVKKEIRERLAQEQENGRTLSVVEAALLLEDHYQEICDEIWAVCADREIRIQRLMESRGYSREKCERIMAAQKDDRYYKEQADFVVDNSTDPEKLREMVAERLRKIL